MNTDETSLTLDTKCLKPSPINLEIYGEEETDYRLIDSIKEKGQLEPLTVIKDKEVPGEYVIISGHRRWAALKVLEEKADCRVVSFGDDELEMKEAIIEYNKYRKKKPSQIVNEANLLRSIYAEKAKKCQLNALKQNTVGPNSAQRNENEIKVRRTRDKVADAVGMGRDKLKKLIDIKEKADDGDEDAIELMEKIDNEELTVNGASTYLELIEAAKSGGPESDYALELLNYVHREEMTSNQAIEKLQRLRKKISARERERKTIQRTYIQRKKIDRNDDGPYSVLLADFSDSLHLLGDYMHLNVPFISPCVLCLLTATPYLKESLDIMEWFGFEYKSMCIWDRSIKTSTSWFKGSNEILLLGTRGEWPAPDPKNQFPSIISEKKGNECVHKMLQKMFPDQKYIDLLPKEKHEGWDNWILEEETNDGDFMESRFNKVFDDLDQNESIKMIIKSKKKPDGTLDAFDDWY